MLISIVIPEMKIYYKMIKPYITKDIEIPAFFISNLENIQLTLIRKKEFVASQSLPCYCRPSSPPRKMYLICRVLLLQLSSLLLYDKRPYYEFIGPYFPVFKLNTKIYKVNLRIQFEYGKMWTKKNFEYGHFLCCV